MHIAEQRTQGPGRGSIKNFGERLAPRFSRDHQPRRRGRPFSVIIDKVAALLPRGLCGCGCGRAVDESTALFVWRAVYALNEQHAARTVVRLNYAAREYLDRQAR